MSDLDLDALDRRAHKRIEMPGAPWITGTEVLALIQRLREAEAGWEATETTRNIAFNAIELLEDRVAQLERVREAVIDYLGGYVDRDALNAALDAVEKKST